MRENREEGLEKNTEKWIEPFIRGINSLQEDQQWKGNEPVVLRQIFLQQNVLLPDQEQIEKWKSCLWKNGFPHGLHTELAAVYLAEQKEEFQVEPGVNKMKKLYKAIQEIILEEPEAAVLWSAFLAASDITVPELQQRMGRIQELLRHWIGYGRELIQMNFILLLFHTDDIVFCERALWIYQSAKEKRFCCDSPEQLSLLALLAVVREKGKTVVEEARSTSLQIKKECAKLPERTAEAAGIALYLYIQFEEKKKRGKDVVIYSLKGNLLLLIELICASIILPDERE